MASENMTMSYEWANQNEPISAQHFDVSWLIVQHAKSELSCSILNLRRESVASAGHRIRVIILQIRQM